MLEKRRKPLASTWLTMKPISSMWAATITLAPRPRLTAIRLPSVSVRTESARPRISFLICSRIRSSLPDGPWVSVIRLMRSFMMDPCVCILVG